MALAGREEDCFDDSKYSKENENGPSECLYWLMHGIVCLLKCDDSCPSMGDAPGLAGRRNYEVAVVIAAIALVVNEGFT